VKICRKKMPNGEMSPTFYVRARVGGKTISRSTGQSDEKKATAWARRHIDKLRGQSSAKGLVENYRDFLAGGQPIGLDEAFGLFTEKPKRRQMGDKQAQAKEGFWGDFVAFLWVQYHQAKKLSQVTREMAAAYITHIRAKGRFVRETTYRQARRGKTKTVTSKNRSAKLSNRTCNVIHTALQQVFEVLRHDAGLIDNPFAGIPKLKNESQTREAFTREELEKIGEQADPFLYPVFLIGISTGLREGDICTLRWSEVDLQSRWITRRMRKTGKEVRIPILPGLHAYLTRHYRRGTYVLPLQARMYKRNPDGISYRVKKFLGDIKIKNTRRVQGRSRAATTKDVHSLRHTFCYVAALHDVPLPVVQSIVGHVDARVTEIYTAHVQDAAKQEKLAALPDYLSLREAVPVEVVEPDAELPAHERVIELLEAATADTWQLVIRDAAEMLRALDSEADGKQGGP